MTRVRGHIHRAVEVVSDIADRHEAVRAFRESHPDVPVDEVEGDDGEVYDVVAICEACGRAIFDDEDYGTDEDRSVYLHRECAEKGG